MMPDVMLFKSMLSFLDVLHGGICAHRSWIERRSRVFVQLVPGKAIDGFRSVFCC